MERRVGEIFVDQRDLIQVIAPLQSVGCGGCIYANSRVSTGNHCTRDRAIAGECAPWLRSDKTSVIFVSYD